MLESWGIARQKGEAVRFAAPSGDFDDDIPF